MCVRSRRCRPFLKGGCAVFTSDRDLVSREPELLSQIGWLSQRKLFVNGSISGGVLTILTGSLAGSGVAAGDVALVNRTPVEIVEVLSATSATVSVVRASVDDPVVAPSDTVTTLVSVTGFGPQRRWAHRRVLGAFGLAETAGEGESTGRPDAGAVVNVEELADLESVLALWEVLSSAAALSAEGSPIRLRAASYLEKWERMRFGAVAMLDLDGDGIAETTRRAGVVSLDRV